MRVKKHRPWLGPGGEELSAQKLKSICESWNHSTWAAYLGWYQEPLQEKLVEPFLYGKLCDSHKKSIFAQFGQNTSAKNKRLCDQLLSRLSAAEATVIRLTLFDGRTLREIASEIALSKSHVHRIKNKAISRLKREISAANGTPTSIWETRLSKTPNPSDSHISNEIYV